MRDRLGLHAWWNNPVANPTQTYLTRLERVPHGPMESAFSKAQKAWKDFQDNSLKSIYDEYFD